MHSIEELVVTHTHGDVSIHSPVALLPAQLLSVELSNSFHLDEGEGCSDLSVVVY